MSPVPVETTARAVAGVVYQRSPGCDSSRLGPDFVVLDGAGTTLRGLNPTGARVWELIDGRASAGQIAERVAAEFGGLRERVLIEVLEFLNGLLQRRLLEPTRGGGR